MPGRAKAVESGKNLENAVAQIASRLGLEVMQQVKVGRRIWGTERRIDLVLRNPSGLSLGVECKYQGKSGTAEEKIPSLIQDIQAWPIDGLVVIDGQGFSNHMKAFLLSTGKAVFLGDLEIWLRLFFRLALV
jgi:hypothetical protein